MATDNVLEIKNLHTYFYTDGGVIKAVDGVDVKLRRGATLGICLLYTSNGKREQDHLHELFGLYIIGIVSF